MSKLNHNFKEWLVADKNGLPVLNPAYRFLFSYGGRGGGKSEFVAEELLLVGTSKKLKILCAREFMNSIDDSVLSLLEQKADEHFKGFYKKRNNKLYGRNGTIITFVGLARNIGSIKSKDGYDICWVEEGQYISARAWELLEPTIRKAGSQFIITMNRESDNSILDKNFIQNSPPKGTSVVNVNLEDNPYDTPILDEMAEECKYRDIETYNYIWKGELNRLSKAEVLSGKYIIEDFDTPRGVTFYHGADWSNGGAHPHAFTRSFIVGNELYIDWEFCSTLDMDENMYESLDSCPTLDRKTYSQETAWRIYCDEANPANTKRLKKNGFKSRPAPKNFGGSKGSKMAGKEYLRAFDAIHVHKTRCPETASNCKNWKWKVDDRSAEVLPIFIDGNDDCLDSLRYAHVKNIKKGL